MHALYYTGTVYLRMAILNTTVLSTAQHVAAATAAADPYDLPPDPYFTLQCNHCLLLSHASTVGVKTAHFPLFYVIFELYMHFLVSFNI
jgi:hypothetical protein